MGVRFPGQANSTPITANFASAAETVAIISQPLNIALDFQQVIILCYFAWTPGTGATGVTWRIRRGTTTAGIAITTLTNLPATAGVQSSFTCVFQDTPGAVAGIQYSLTALQIGASGASANQDGCIAVLGL